MLKAPSTHSTPDNMTSLPSDHISPDNILVKLPAKTAHPRIKRKEDESEVKLQNTHSQPPTDNTIEGQAPHTPLPDGQLTSQSKAATEAKNGAEDGLVMTDWTTDEMAGTGAMGAVPSDSNMLLAQANTGSVSAGGGAKAATAAKAGTLFGGISTTALIAGSAAVVGVGVAVASSGGKDPTPPAPTAPAAPTLTLIIADNVAPATTNIDVTFTFTFSNPVTGFTVADVIVTGGTKAASFLSGGGRLRRLYTGGVPFGWPTEWLDYRERGGERGTECNGCGQHSRTGHASV